MRQNLIGTCLLMCSSTHQLALGLFIVAAVTGCRADKCKSAAPAFQVDVSLAAGVDGGRIKDLLVQIDAAGLHREQVVGTAGMLDDGRTSFAVDVGAAGTKGFTAAVTVTARDASGVAVAVGRGTFNGWGDACNFFELALGGGGDGRVPADTRSDFAAGKVKVSTVAGDGTCSQLCGPHGLYLMNGGLYVASRLSHRIWVWDGKLSKLAPFAGTGVAGYAAGALLDAQFNAPTAVSSDASGAILVSDAGNHCIRSLSSTSASVFAGIPGKGGTMDGPTLKGALFDEPGSTLIVGTVTYVVDVNSHRIRMIDDSLMVTTFAGNGAKATVDGPLLSASFNAPHGIAHEKASGALYVVERDGHVVRRILKGQVTTFAGSTQGFADGPLLQAKFSSPAAIIVHEGVLMVADYGNHRIRQIKNGQVTTLAGSGIKGHVDGAAFAAQLGGPRSLALDATAGVLYVADYDLPYIRAITGLAL